MSSSRVSKFKRLRAGSAHRQARGVAGGVAGVEFGLFMMMKPDYNEFLGGYGAFGFALLFYLLELGYLMSKNYQDSNPDSWEAKHRADEEKAVASAIKAEWSASANLNEVVPFLKETVGDEAAQSITDALLVDDDARLYEELCKVYAVLHSDFGKYPHAIVFSMFCFFGHLVEMNLAQFSFKSTVFDFKAGGLDDKRNWALVAVMLFALQQSVECFKEVKASYEAPSSPYALKATIMNGFTQFKDSHRANAESKAVVSQNEELRENLLNKV